MNTERPVDEEPKYKLSRYCDKPKKRRRRNDPNRKCAEQYSTERKNLKKKIWREDLAQPQRDPLTKLAKVFTSTTLSQISSMKTSSRIWILWFDQRIIYQPPLHPNPQRILLTGQTSASSNWFIPSLHVCNRKEEKKNPMERWPFSSPRFPVHMRVVLVTRVSTCLVMTDWTTWKGMAWTWPGCTGLHGTGLWVLD